MIIFTNVRKSADYKVFILLNVHPAAKYGPKNLLTRAQYDDEGSKLCPEGGKNKKMTNGS